MVELQRRVYESGIGSLPGSTLNTTKLVPLLQKAVRASTISPERYDRMMSLLRYGADLFIDQDYLRQHLPARV